MKTKFRVTVIYDVLIDASSETEAEELAGEMELSDNYVLDSFDVTAVKVVKE